MHKNDPGTYCVTFFNELNRKDTRQRLAPSLIKAQKLGRRWKRITGGSAVVHMCVHNTESGNRWNRGNQD